MKWLAQRIWHGWFFLLTLVDVLIMSPFLAMTIWNKKLFTAFHWFSGVWGFILGYGTGFHTKVIRNYQGELPHPGIICANHSSFLDIILCFQVFRKPFVFVGKKELGKIPVFGYFYKRAALLVDRSSPESRRQVVLKAKEKLQENISICIYPEGGIPRVPTRLAPFKTGAFRIASELNVPIIPVTFADNKRKFPAYKMKGSPGRVRVIIHPAEYPDLSQKNPVEELKTRVYNIINQSLIEHGCE